MNNKNEIENKLKEIKVWAKEKIKSGQEPPWAWYQYMKLCETIDAILAGMAVTITLEDSQKLGQPQDVHHLQEVDNDQPENAQSRPSPIPVQMPM